MKCSLGTSNFLEKISRLSHSLVFLYFFALITEEGFLISPDLLWNSAFKWVYLFFFSLPFTSLLFTAICEASSDNHFAFLHFFSLGMVLIPASCTMSSIRKRKLQASLAMIQQPSGRHRSRWKAYGTNMGIAAGGSCAQWTMSHPP